MSLQGIRARGPSPLSTPGCLQTKLWSHSLAHPNYCLDQRLLFPEWCPWHRLRFPDSEVVRSRRVLRGHPVHFPSEVGPSSPTPVPEVLSCLLLCFTWVLFPLKKGVPYTPMAYVSLCALQCIPVQVGGGRAQGQDWMKNHPNSSDKTTAHQVVVCSFSSSLTGF